MNFTFKGLSIGEIPYIVVKSWFRDWVLGLEEEWAKEKRINREIPSPFISSLRWLANVASLILLFYLVKNKMSGLAPFSVPFMVGDSAGCGASGASGGSGDGDPGSMSADCATSATCSFVYEYETRDGTYMKAAISEPRAWHYNTEVIEFPREAVLPNGELHLRIKSTKNHILGFVGAIQNIDKFTEKHTEEILPISAAYHSRGGSDFTEILCQKEGGYAHLIPGDTLSLEFTHDACAPRNKKETYLMRASGFYTALRRSSRQQAGNWRNRISPEAKERLASLRPLRTYLSVSHAE